MPDSIFRRPLTGLLLLAGAAGGPYVWYETEVGKNVWNSATTGLEASGDGSNTSPWAGLGGRSDFYPASSQPYRDSGSNLAGRGGFAQPNGPKPSDPFHPNVHSLEQLPVVSLAEILRFDISPEWVMARFPRVSTLLSEMNLDGLRTPLITGSTPGDLAGTLTYYFDRYKRLKRVSVHATLGDPTRYIMELRQAYQMSQEPSLGGSLYVVKWNGTPTSVLHVSPASVVYSDVNYGRYNFFLELNQADLEYGLSAEARQLIESGRSMNRW